MMNPDVKTILIIEDEETILEALKEYLESQDFNVLTAEDGVAALEVLQKNKMPDLLVLDIKMPRMNGWEFAKVYFTDYKNPAPIIVSTAAIDAQQRAKDVNAVDWVEKPFNLDILLEKIKKHVK